METPPAFPSHQAAAGAAARQQVAAWVTLVGALAVHVADEALTDFLAFYNANAVRIRADLPWLALPTLSFPAWVTAMAFLLVLLSLLTPSVRGGQAWSRVAAYALGAVAIANGVVHLAGSAVLGQWLPGANSGPLLIAAGLWLVVATRRRPFRAGPHP